MDIKDFLDEFILSHMVRPCLVKLQRWSAIFELNIKWFNHPSDSEEEIMIIILYKYQQWKVNKRCLIQSYPAGWFHLLF